MENNIMKEFTHESVSYPTISIMMRV